MFCWLGAGEPTLTVTGVDPVRPLRLSETPGIVCVAPGAELVGVGTATPLIVFEVEYWVGPPLIVYAALVPAWAYWVCSASAPAESPVIVTKEFGLAAGGAPVLRSDNTITDWFVLGSTPVTVAHTLAFLSLLIALARSCADAPAARLVSWPSIVIVSADVGLVNSKVRWEALARALTET